MLFLYFQDMLNVFVCFLIAVGRSSYINHAKQVTELVPFQWLDLPKVKMKAQMKSVITATIGL